MGALPRALIAVVLGVAALATLIAAEVQSWPLGPLTAGMLGSLAGGVLGYLAPSPLGGPAPGLQRLTIDAPPRVMDALGVDAAAFDARERQVIAVPRPTEEATTRRIEDVDG